MKFCAAALASALTLVGVPVAVAEPAPPLAAKRPFMVTSPNGAREDDYYWIRDDTRKDPEMLGYLAAENTNADAVLAPTKPLQDALYKEFVGRIKQDESSVPYLRRGYWYYSRFETGADYPLLARRKGSMQAPEAVMLNEPQRAAGKGFYAASGAVVSPDNRLLAFAEDTVGQRQYVLKVKDLATGRMLKDEVAALGQLHGHRVQTTKQLNASGRLKAFKKRPVHRLQIDRIFARHGTKESNPSAQRERKNLTDSICRPHTGEELNGYDRNHSPKI